MYSFIFKENIYHLIGVTYFLRFHFDVIHRFHRFFSDHCIIEQSPTIKKTRENLPELKLNVAEIDFSCSQLNPHFYRILCLVLQLTELALNVQILEELSYLSHIIH